MKANKLPELLCPAGSPESLDAALAAGADAVYFGAKSFNARNGAANFSEAETMEAIRKCRVLGVKTNITVNTQLYDTELLDALSLVGNLIDMGADAFIVADLGLARIIKSVYPHAELHASTQACGQNVYSAAALKSLGFSRMVAPRELSFENIKKLSETSPIETEIFVHGALCVSFSGQCLMSSVIGGRSGNRGECAQPCRLPYKCSCSYPLSLKDSCLAGHITDILDMNIASLKIEGRMKSPDYVYGVASIYRRLLDEGRNATADEIEKMSDLFSRSGFTDGYFAKRIDSDMLGIRTDEQKRASSNAEKLTYEKRKLDTLITGDFSVLPSVISAKAVRGGKEFAVSAEMPAPNGEMTPLSDERLVGALSKCGGTPFALKGISVKNGEGAALPVSTINSVRRELLSSLEEKLASFEKCNAEGEIPAAERRGGASLKTAYFRYAKSIPDAAYSFFDAVFVPISEYVKLANPNEKLGIELPPICYDTETEHLLSNVEKAKNAGCRYALATSAWQIGELLKRGFFVVGDQRLNVNNAHSASVIYSMGASAIIASPEIGVSKCARFGASAVMYGRLPIMTTEKCAIREIKRLRDTPCSYCDTHDFTLLKDRTDTEFLVCRELPHRNVIYNSVPVWMCDKGAEYERLNVGAHFIFTNERADEVIKIINGAKKKLSFSGKFKRI